MLSEAYIELQCSAVFPEKWIKTETERRACVARVFQLTVPVLFDVCTDIPYCQLAAGQYGTFKFSIVSHL